MLYFGISPFKLVDSAGAGEEEGLVVSSLTDPKVDMATDASSLIFSSLSDDSIDLMPPVSVKLGFLSDSTEVSGAAVVGVTTVGAVVSIISVSR